MSLDKIKSPRKVNDEDEQLHEKNERKDGFYSSCGQAFIRVPIK
jgi:hypothetical protein